MNKTMFYENEMRTILRRKLGCYKTQHEMADDMGISESLLSKVLKGERSITAEMAEHFGYKRVVLFVVPVEEKAEA